MMPRSTWAGACLSLLLATTSHAFYIPGISIKTYKDGENVPLFVNKLQSSKTQLQYAYSELGFVCTSSGKRRGKSLWSSGTSLSLSLGEVLRGDRITMSDYILDMGKDEEIRLLCQRDVDAEGVAQAQSLIRDDYVAEWIVDNLPGATSFVSSDGLRKSYSAGFKIGREEVDANDNHRYYLNNHVTLQILYRKVMDKTGEKSTGEKVIVGFEVYPKSISSAKRDKNGLPKAKDVEKPKDGFLLEVPEDAKGNAGSISIPFTYSVYFKEEPTLDWHNRWDLYFVNQEETTRIHWFAIVNSVMICGLLTAVVAVILARTVRGDIAAGTYRDAEAHAMRPRRLGRKSKLGRGSTDGVLARPDGASGDGDDVSDDDDGDIPLEETTGWKLLHGDVFRKPARGGLLAPLVGSGTQLMFMAAGLVLLSCLGLLNPSFRGGYISVGFALFVLAGLLSGYFSARLYATFGGDAWRKNVLVTAALVPGLAFAISFVLNFFVWAQASSTAIPFTTLLALLALWLLIQLPLVYVGGYVGHKRVGAWKQPLKTNAVPRQIPPAAGSNAKAARTVLLAGLVPFVVVLIELLFIFRNLWQDKTGFYYVFGFVAVVGTILAVVVCEVAIVVTYVRLCSENHHWHWHAFFAGASSAVWVYAYCAWFFFTSLRITGFVSALLFFSYSLLACAAYGILTGALGFLAAYAFVRRIYGAIKVD